MIEILIASNIITITFATYLWLRVNTLKDINERLEDRAKVMKEQWEKHWKDKHPDRKKDHV